MTQFSSGKHEKLTDAEPWAYARNSKTGPGPFGTPDRAATRVDKAMLYFPRPEFDRPLSNPENPILADLRESDYGPADFLAALDRIRPLPAGTGHRVEPAHVDHARRVLTLLVALS